MKIQQDTIFHHTNQVCAQWSLHIWCKPKLTGKWKLEKLEIIDRKRFFFQIKCVGDYLQIDCCCFCFESTQEASLAGELGLWLLAEAWNVGRYWGTYSSLPIIGHCGSHIQTMTVLQAGGSWDQLVTVQGTVQQSLRAAQGLATSKTRAHVLNLATFLFLKLVWLFPLKYDYRNQICQDKHCGAQSHCLRSPHATGLLCWWSSTLCVCLGRQQRGAQ